MAINKMFIMLPIMFAARKLDGEDPNIIFMLRCSYGIVQCLILLALLYMYMCAVKISQGKYKDDEIFVPPPQAQPFADPNAKTKYTKTTLGEHALSVVKKLIFSTITGIMMTCGLHWYKGMVVGLAMQSIMGPLNFFENPFAKSIFFGSGSSSGGKEEKGKEEGGGKRRYFDEKYRDEIGENDEIVDSEGKLIILKKAKKEKGTTTTTGKKSFADLLLDTWDNGATADIGPLVKALTKDNVNMKTEENGWTPLMIMAAIGAKGATDAMRKMKDLGADVKITDNEGWNALHWTAFHGSVEGAKVLMEDFDGMKLGLHLVKDTAGMTPLDHAIKEENSAVASFLKSKVASAILSDQVDGIAEKEGIRKRK